jgi:hypothetical protein
MRNSGEPQRIWAVPPHAVDSAFGAYRDEGRRLAVAVKGTEAVDRALRGEPL